MHILHGPAPFPISAIPLLSYISLSTLFSSSHFNAQYLFPSKRSLTFQKFLLFLLTCLEQNFQVPEGVQLHKTQCWIITQVLEITWDFTDVPEIRNVIWTTVLVEQSLEIWADKENRKLSCTSLSSGSCTIYDTQGFNCILFLLTCRFLEFSLFNLFYSCFVSFLTLKMTFNYLEKK